VTTYLLDANVLIALSVEEHEHHLPVAAWIRGVDRVALCPIVEGSLVRFLVRIGESARVAAEVLRLLHANRICEFWPDSMSYVQADLSGVQGHRLLGGTRRSPSRSAPGHARPGTRSIAPRPDSVDYAALRDAADGMRATGCGRRDAILGPRSVPHSRIVLVSAPDTDRPE